jgi:hypothetical protein
MIAEFIKKLLFGGFTGRRHSVSQETELKIKRDWENIELMLQQKSPAQLKQALLMADKALENALKDVVTGETMGERLKNAKQKFDPVTYNKLWEAHKIRNSMVHESGYEPPYFMLIEAIGKLKKGLLVLGVKL